MTGLASVLIGIVAALAPLAVVAVVLLHQPLLGLLVAVLAVLAVPAWLVLLCVAVDGWYLRGAGSLTSLERLSVLFEKSLQLREIGKALVAKVRNLFATIRRRLRQHWAEPEQPAEPGDPEPAPASRARVVQYRFANLVLAFMTYVLVPLEVLLSYLTFAAMGFASMDAAPSGDLDRNLGWLVGLLALTQGILLFDLHIWAPIAGAARRWNVSRIRRLSLTLICLTVSCVLVYQLGVYRDETMGRVEPITVASADDDGGPILGDAAGPSSQTDLAEATEAAATAAASAQLSPRAERAFKIVQIGLPIDLFVTLLLLATPVLISLRLAWVLACFVGFWIVIHLELMLPSDLDMDALHNSYCLALVQIDAMLHREGANPQAFQEWLDQQRARARAVEAAALAEQVQAEADRVALAEEAAAAAERTRAAAAERARTAEAERTRAAEAERAARAPVVGAPVGGPGAGQPEALANGVAPYGTPAVEPARPPAGAGAPGPFDQFFAETPGAEGEEETETEPDAEIQVEEGDDNPLGL